MSTKEILEKYLNFYKERGHKQVPNVSLIPEGDSTLLFVNSGMFPLVPYLSGLEHPLGKRLVNVQRAGRFDVDLDEIGDYHHTTAFHMIGNWSLGDYFKDQQLPWAYEFLVEELGLDPQKLYPTVFAGDEYAPKDTESIEILKKIFAKYGIDANEDERIFACGRDKNWWQRGDAAGELGGPDSEVYYYLGEGAPLGKNPSMHETEFLEIGNSVFMQYKKTKTGWEELPQKNVDFGGGLERIAMVVQGKGDIYETDNFWPIIEKLQLLSGKDYKESEDITRNTRILADHIRGTTYMAMDGVLPSNKDQGYILRRLLRRMVRAGMFLGLKKDISVALAPVVCDMFAWLYPDLPEKREAIMEIFAKEEQKFLTSILNSRKKVLKELSTLEKTTNSDSLGRIAFTCFQSLGYPLEAFIEDLVSQGFSVDEIKITKSFDKEMGNHQEISRAGAEQKFKGGLADQSENTIRYHTATHLLHMALRKVLGGHVVQQGSNITGARLRFDINHNTKLTDTQIESVEKLISDAVDSSMPVNFEIMPKEQAERTGAIHAFGEKYGYTVKVYYIGKELKTAVSKEFCGGPHVQNTADIGHIEIFKQDKIGENLLRVYARFSS